MFLKMFNFHSNNEEFILLHQNILEKQLTAVILLKSAIYCFSKTLQAFLCERLWDFYRSLVCISAYLNTAKVSLNPSVNGLFDYILVDKKG